MSFQVHASFRAAVCGMAAAFVVSTALPHTATAGPVNSNDPQIVINDLQSEGYRVIVSRNGTGNLSACSVSSATTQTSASNVQPTRRMRNQPTVLPPPRRKIAYVTLAC